MDWRDSDVIGNLKDLDYVNRILQKGKYPKNLTDEQLVEIYQSFNRFVKSE